MFTKAKAIYTTFKKKEKTIFEMGLPKMLAR
jgi:hypothetical protein